MDQVGQGNRSRRGTRVAWLPIGSDVLRGGLHGALLTFLFLDAASVVVMWEEAPEWFKPLIQFLNGGQVNDRLTWSTVGFYALAVVLITPNRWSSWKSGLLQTASLIMASIVATGFLRVELVSEFAGASMPFYDFSDLIVSLSLLSIGLFWMGVGSVLLRSLNRYWPRPSSEFRL